jgi:hypothetical protein
MYIYIEGKEPVARKSKSLAEMGVKDGDNLIVTTEMKLPYNVNSDSDCIEGPNAGPYSGFMNDQPGGGMDMRMGVQDQVQPGQVPR